MAFKLPIIPPWVKPVALLVVAAGLVAGGWRLGSDHVIAKQAKEKDLIERAADAVEGRVAKRISDIRVVNQTNNAKTRELVYENTYYRDCTIDDATRRLLDDARAGVESAAGGSSLPEAGPDPAP